MICKLALVDYRNNFLLYVINFCYMFKQNNSRKNLPISDLPDVQNEKSHLNVHAGISNFKTVYYGYGWQLPIDISVIVSTDNTRGVHMSRLVKTTKKFMHTKYIEESLLNIQKEANLTQKNCKVIVHFQYPFEDQFLDVSITLDDTRNFNYLFSLPGITSCPCSKATAGIGHMQRTVLKLELSDLTLVNFDETALDLSDCFSAKLEEFLTRSDEAKKIIEAQENSKFVEDVVRDCKKRFPHAKYINATSLESIHSHNAVAYWDSTNQI